MFKKLWDKWGINPLDKQLQMARLKGAKTFLIPWNRGLGDIPLGLFALVHRIRQYIPEAQVTFLTREDLKDGFALLKDVDVLVAHLWKRGVPFDLESTLKQLGSSISSFDWIIEKPDPTRWLQWQLGRLIPQLEWKGEWDTLHEPFELKPCALYVGVHVQTETHYAYEKNWPLAKWEELFDRLIQEKGAQILLFGFSQTPPFKKKGVLDLRGKTNLFQMLSIIKNRCSYLVVPDSGVLSITYYINASFPIKIASLWADPKQGVLRQKVSSPNPKLVHVPLIAPKEIISAIPVEKVMHALFAGSET